MNARVDQAAKLLVLGLLAAALIGAAPFAELPPSEHLVDGITFGEGPAWDGNGVYFTDIPKARIHYWTEAGGGSVAYEDTGRANGLLVDAAGNLYACEMGNGRITRRAPDGTVTLTVDTSSGKRLNMTNDLWMAPDGGLYFTDPIYGKAVSEEQGGEHVHYLAPGKTEAAVAARDFVRPNGIVGTPDGKTLYVADHAGETTYAFDIGEGGALENRRRLIGQGSDGMALDADGNLYLTWKKNVDIFAPSGEKLASIPFEKNTTNATFGGPGLKTLFVTCADGLHRVKMPVAGAKFTKPAPAESGE